MLISRTSLLRYGYFVMHLDESMLNSAFGCSIVILINDFGDKDFILCSWCSYFEVASYLALLKTVDMA